MRLVAIGVARRKAGVYAFELQRREGGPPLEVRYPPTDGRAVYLLGDAFRFSVVARAATGTKVREVFVNGRRVFPVRTPPEFAGRMRVAIVGAQANAPEERLLVEAIDSAGRKSACLVIPLERARAGASAAPRATR